MDAVSSVVVNLRLFATEFYQSTLPGCPHTHRSIVVTSVKIHFDPLRTNIPLDPFSLNLHCVALTDAPEVTYIPKHALLQLLSSAHLYIYTSKRAKCASTKCPIKPLERQHTGARCAAIFHTTDATMHNIRAHKFIHIWPHHSKCKISILTSPFLVNSSIVPRRRSTEDGHVEIVVERSTSFKVSELHQVLYVSI